MFSDENDFFFSVFSCILENALKNILQYCVKYRAEGAGGEACVFGKWFTKKLGVNHFQILTKDFPVNGNYFPFDHHFTVKQIPANLKIFSKNYFTAKQTEP
jgi:hypothetical protein